MTVHRFDRASLIDSFKQIKERGVRYEDVFPGSYDAKERIKELIEDETDAEADAPPAVIEEPIGRVLMDRF